VLSTIEEADNQINSLSYRNDGLQFATGGSDVTIRVYDSLSSKTSLQLKSTEETVTRVAHSNRIFCTKFHHTDPNLIISGGWDNTVKVKVK
jgi:WD40 repeat protein